MRRILHYTLGLVLAVSLGGILAGCDETPTSVEDFDFQPSLESPSTAGLVLIGESATSLSFTYQGLDGRPTFSPTGSLQAEVTSEEGTARRGGSSAVRLTYDGTPTGIVREQLVVTGNAEGRTISDTVAVSIAPFVVQTDFRPNSVTVIDYDARSYAASGGASATLVESSMAGLNNTTGVNTLEIEDPGAGAGVEFTRAASAPNSDRFQFAIRPDASSDFNLTITFTEEASGGTETYEYTLPVEAGTSWLQLGIGFEQIGADFNPVATRAGGTGALQSVSFSADSGVTYYLDDISFATEATSQVEIHNFEDTTLEYSCNSLSDSPDVANESAGFTSRRVDGGGCFGYNYNGLKVDLSASGALSFRVKNTVDGDMLKVFLQTRDGNAGGFTFDAGPTISLPAASEWTTVTVPVGDLGEEPSALFTSGLENIGFDVSGADPDFLIDDVRLEPGGN